MYLHMVIFILSQYPYPEPPIDNQNFSPYPPSPPPPPATVTVTSEMFMNEQHNIPINNIYCKGAKDIALDSNLNVYIACEESECVYTIKNGVAICLQDRAFYHYNAHLNSIDIRNEMMVTCQNSANDYAGTKTANMFMGLTLYNLSVPLIRTDGSSYNSSDNLQIPFLTHVDMLHEAPNCTGVVSINKNWDNQQETNRYAHIDGFNGHIMITDFKSPHGVGQMDHSTALVERLFNVPLSSSIGKLCADIDNDMLYIADTGANRLIEVAYTSGVNTMSAKRDFPIFSAESSDFEYYIKENVTWAKIAQIDSPISVDIYERYAYVLDMDGFITIVDINNRTKILKFFADSNAESVRIFDRTMYVVSDHHVKTFAKTSPIGLSFENCATNCSMLGAGQSCHDHNDCDSLNCYSNTCYETIYTPYTSINNLQFYINSEVYNRSFVNQHILTGGVGSYASYLNLYPLMEDDFCIQVGNASGVPDCDLIDFDSLLLGNCWGHPCLPNHLHCMNDGNVVSQGNNGYICECPKNYIGDKCHVHQNAARIDFQGDMVKNSYIQASCCTNTNCIINFNF